MARNGSGTMSIVNSFTPSTTISSSAVNANFSDIADEITNSLAADGQTTMTGAIKGANGSAAAPAYGFGSDPDTGIYRKGANSLGFAVAGGEEGYIDSSGNWVIPNGDLTLSAGDLVLTAGSLSLGAALPIADGGTGQTSAASAFNALKQDATTSATGVVELATDAEIRSSASGKVLTTDQIESASGKVTLTDAATIAVDWDSFIWGEVTLGGNRTLGQPSNVQVGTYRTITVTTDGSTRQLAFHSSYLGNDDSITDVDSTENSRVLMTLFGISSGVAIVSGVVRY